MKLAVDSNKILQTIDALKALDSLNLLLNDTMLVDDKTYVYFTHGSDGIKPNNLDYGDLGRWINKIKHHEIITKVDDDYDFAGNGKEEIINESLINEFLGGYEVESDVDDVIIKKDVRTINYKTELKSGKSYTPVFIKHYIGVNAGLLDKTEYYRGYVDDNDRGVLVLVVEEVYEIDDSDGTVFNSQKDAIQRDKKWKHVKVRDGLVEDDINKIKIKNKKYDTRAKRHKESKRRRDNIEGQLIDHVGLAGVISGIFVDTNEAYNKLTEMQESHSSAFTSWKNSGRGSIYNDMSTDVTAWLDAIIPDNGMTQSMCSWMIGLSFRSYMIEKLKGNVK